MTLYNRERETEATNEASQSLLLFSYPFSLISNAESNQEKRHWQVRVTNYHAEMRNDETTITVNISCH